MNIVLSRASWAAALIDRGSAEQQQKPAHPRSLGSLGLETAHNRRLFSRKKEETRGSRSHSSRRGVDWPAEFWAVLEWPRAFCAESNADWRRTILTAWSPSWPKHRKRSRRSWATWRTSRWGSHAKITNLIRAFPKPGPGSRVARGNLFLLLFF